MESHKGMNTGEILEIFWQIVLVQAYLQARRRRVRAEGKPLVRATLHNGPASRRHPHLQVENTPMWRCALADLGISSIRVSGYVPCTNMDDAEQLLWSNADGKLDASECHVLQPS